MNQTLPPSVDHVATDAETLALFGGVYSNYLALEAAIHDALQRGAERLYCLGDLGAFGPHPDRVFPLLRKHGVICLQGNYDDSIGNARDDCQCGYTDPRDNYYAQISYEYTLRNTSDANREFLRSLPPQRRERWGNREVLMCHGSPRRVNEFLWESTTSTAFLERLCEQHRADTIFATHTGIKWTRQLSRERQFVNVGALGRPEHDGRTEVWYTLVKHLGLVHRASQGSPAMEARPVAETRAATLPPLEVQFVPVQYDFRRLAEEMRSEQLPEAFVETILTGWWTTCREVLPSKERLRPGRLAKVPPFPPIGRIGLEKGRATADGTRYDKR
ncbi:MAG: metallophosphoesterase [Planctomycetales bacterium]|nr:metallophosphoesterase [Planctomycetales bacterium]